MYQDLQSPSRKKFSVGNPKKFVNRKIVAWVLIGLGLIGLVVSGVLLLSSRNNPKPPPGISLTHAPSAVKPTPKAVAAYTVAPDLPKYITIPTISVNEARVVGLGLLKDGEISNPDNIYDAGWYKASAKPGQAGAMFIYGHVSSWTANGVFYNLKKLKAGNQIIISRGDDQTFTYQVVTSKTFPRDAVDMNAVLAPVDPNKPGLNLMTCTGKVIPGTSDFTERLVVFTSLV